MNKPPKSGVASIRPVRENVSTTAVKLKAAAKNASQTAACCARVGWVGTR